MAQLEDDGKPVCQRMPPHGHAHTDRRTTPKHNASSPICRMDRGITEDTAMPHRHSTVAGEEMSWRKRYCLVCIGYWLSKIYWRKIFWLPGLAKVVFHHIHTHPFNGPFLRLPGWAGTRKVKPIWILLKQETASGSGISWAVCKSAPRSRQTTMPAPHHSVFYRPDALPAAHTTASKHWRHIFPIVFH